MNKYLYRLLISKVDRVQKNKIELSYHMRNILIYLILPRVDLIGFKELIEIRYFYDTLVFIVLSIMYNNINCFIFSQKSRFNIAKVSKSCQSNQEKFATCCLHCTTHCCFVLLLF